MSFTTNLSARARARKPSLDQQTRERFYFASPKSEYESARYARLLHATRDHFPDAEFIESRTAFADMNEWRRNWSAVLGSISGLVFIASADGWIGRGVWAEIREASERIPVYHLTSEGRVLTLAAVRFSEPNPEDWARHVHVQHAELSI